MTKLTSQEIQVYESKEVKDFIKNTLKIELPSVNEFNTDYLELK